MNDRERPHADDELDAAYARAHALADDGRGPAAAVRARVLAAAREAAHAGAHAADEPLAPVAPPMAEVGRGRPAAANRGAWRLRAGAGACAALLVALGLWRFDANRAAGDRVQVATASVESAPADLQAGDLPVQPRTAAPPSDAAPAPVAAAAKAHPAVPAKPRARHKDRDVVVALVPPTGPRPESPVLAAAAAPPRQEAAPPPQEAPAAAMSRRVATAAVAVADAGPTSSGQAKVAAAGADARRAGIAASPLRPMEVADAAPARFAAARPLPPLQSAAERGDVEALKSLLAQPGVRVDAPDATGRTALLQAVLAQQAAAVRLLLAAGADPAQADQAGLTPRAAAQAAANAEIAGLLAAAH